ncbi:MAG TPA: tetratricopeptide repeat protein [Candidatus Angelobacter sp.]|nr:tetratricopeptide repeat protein [Candidatus Angelobacter sp.]
MASNTRSGFPRKVLLLFFLAAGASAFGQGLTDDKSLPATGGAPQRLPVTTASAASARYFENGMVQYEMHRWNFALNDWREAVKLDPHFALAHAWISMTTVDPAEEASHRDQAKASARKASRGEQLVIEWVAGIHENRYVDGITAMNDALSMYPHDKRLNFLFGYWLYKQDQYDLAEKLTQRALSEDPNYATAYNQMGYLYSRRGDYAKALEATGKYVQLLPSEPNPHDSYGEMLRLSGHFEEALEQYRMALKIDPTFYISQKELGETYAIMGEGDKAREEYSKAVYEAPSDGLKAEYLQKSAMTYLRARQYPQADQAFHDAAEKARAMQQWVWEARAYRIMAMYATDSAAADKNLDKAEALLGARKGAVAQSDLDEEQARIWRVRAERAIAAGNLAGARKAVDRLEQMAKAGSSISIERTYQGSLGTLLLAQRKYTAAVSHLEEDFANPVSMKVLITAYEKNKAHDQAVALQKKLENWKIPSIEEALVVPALHAQDGAVASTK